jgi:hypothetical protein
MSVDVSHHLAQATIDERLRTAAAHRRAKEAQGAPASKGRGGRTSQRELVIASLLLSGRRDRPTHRRWA